MMHRHHDSRVRCVRAAAAVQALGMSAVQTLQTTEHSDRHLLQHREGLGVRISEHRDGDVGHPEQLADEVTTISGVLHHGL
jgi:hypothetical protein